MENGEYVQGSFWFYAPNKGAPIAFAFFFLVSGAWHFWQCLEYGSWHVTGLLPLSATLFIVGFILRGVGAYMYDNQGLFISSTVFLYAAPPFYELCNYVILSRLLHYTPYHAPIQPGRIISTFLSLTMFIETLSASGAAQAANLSYTPYQVAVGKALLKTSLVLQLAVMVLFVSLAAKWQWNCSRGRKLLCTTRGTRRNIKSVMITLYYSCVLITIRTIYRTVEYFEFASFTAPAPGASFEPRSLSPVIRYEWFFWIFEATIMLCNSAMLNVRHPARQLPRSDRTYLAEDGTEKEGVEFGDRRTFWKTLVDPFDIWGILVGNDEKWWEAKNWGAHADPEVAMVVETVRGIKEK